MTTYGNRDGMSALRVLKGISECMQESAPLTSLKWRQLPVDMDNLARLTQLPHEGDTKPDFSTRVSDLCRDRSASCDHVSYVVLVGRLVSCCDL